MIPVLAVAYAALIQPLIYFYFPPAPGLEGLLESRIEDRIFWPVLAAISVVLAARHWSRIRRPLPPNIIGLLAYLAFAGASVAWAFKPELSLIRFVKEIMVLAAIVLPALLAAREADMLRGMFLCFAVAAAVNALLIPGGYATIAQYGSVMVDIGYQGYFSGKNLLGEFAAIALLLSIHELLYPGYRRALGSVIAAVAAVLLFLSSSKTALGLVILAPFLAGLALVLARTIRVSTATILVSIVVGYIVVSSLTGFTTERLAFILTGDSSFTGRTTIWNFAETEIARSPLVGWGYQSFWLAGPDAPSVVDAPGWVKLMPNAHNGYYDTMLELGYVGLAFLLVFLDLDPARHWARGRARQQARMASALGRSLHRDLQSARNLMVAGLRYVVGGVRHCRRRRSSILAGLHAEGASAPTGARSYESRPRTRRVEAPAGSALLAGCRVASSSSFAGRFRARPLAFDRSLNRTRAAATIPSRSDRTRP